MQAYRSKGLVKYVIFSVDLDLINLILKLALKMYLYAENEIPNCGGLKVIAQTDRHTDNHRDRSTGRQTGLKLLPISIRSR